MSDISIDYKKAFITRVYAATIMRYPMAVLVAFIALTLFLGYNAQFFTLDASSDSIVLENDTDLKYYDKTREVFGSDNYIIVMVTPPDGDLFSEKTLSTIAEMKADFEVMEQVETVTSILTVPLFHSPNIPLLLISKGYKTLEGDADPTLAFEEFTSSPLYTNYLISEDGKTTAVQVTFKDPEESFVKLDKRRSELRTWKREGSLTSGNLTELEEVERAYKSKNEVLIAKNNETIDEVRSIVSTYSDSLGQLHIGGVPMVMADIISYVKSDIKTFAKYIIFIVMIVLFLIFRMPRWILLPTAVCVLTVLFMFGYLGYTHWSATIVTSNFPSLLFVIALADVLHVVVHYRELHSRNPESHKRDLILQSMRDVAVPCFYTTVTTIVGFGSLIVSGIRPVMDFGIMMAMGVGLAYLICFTFFPAVLLLIPKGKAPSSSLGKLQKSPLMFFAHFTEKFPKVVFAVSIGGVFFFGMGAQRIVVENRFIDYFKTDSEIYEGMTVIDQRLGGTTPLEVVLEAEESGFWLTYENLKKLEEVHKWLDDQPEIGKVISPFTMTELLTKVNKGKELPVPLIKMALKTLPEDIEKAVVSPYMTPERNQVRISMRVAESDKSLNRKDLITRIEHYFDSNEIFEVGSITPHVTGVFVLYNNMLQSLFTSQIQTIGTVFFLIWLMFLILFRSLKIATIAIIPNVIPVILVLGILGWTGIPLDMMTIMTAAITLGIAVDFAIHYIHRFMHEFTASHNYIESMHRTHNSIGRAMLFTTVTIIAGFSLLTLSNFIPSIYFGIFTSLAIIVAFLASVTLLPLMLISWKSMGKEDSAEA